MSLLSSKLRGSNKGDKIDRAKNIKRLEKLRREALVLRSKLNSTEDEIDRLVRGTPLP